MKRVMIIGGPGSGKTTLAYRLADITGLPRIHMDCMIWSPGWVKRPQKEIRDIILIEISAEEWIIEGNNWPTFEDRIKRVDTLIFLDLPPLLRAFRVALRNIQYHGRVRPETVAGYAQGFKVEALTGAFKYAKEKRAKALALVSSAPRNVNVLHLRTRKEIATFLEGLQIDLARN